MGPVRTAGSGLVPVRGRVYLADLGFGAKPWLVVSNNARNANLPSCLAVRITTTNRVQPRATVIELDSGDPLVGRVLCDDLEQLDRVDLQRDVGALTRSSMAQVAAGLAVALGLSSWR